MLKSLGPKAKEGKGRTHRDGFSPYCASEERIKGIQPVIHVFVIEGLQKDPTVLCEYSKGVRCLKETQGDEKVTKATSSGDYLTYS